MSTGTIVGGVVGAVVGYVVGGPYGAFVGASIGMGIGSWIDPIEPSVTQPGKPKPADLSIVTAKEGDPIPDLNGIGQFAGNIIFHCCDRVEEIKETQGGGGGGGGKGGGGGGGSSQEVVTGYKYYHTWAVAICTGPVDNLYTIWRQDEVIYGQDDIEAEDYTEGLERSGDMDTITLKKGMGSADFYWGTSTASAPSYDKVVNNTVKEGINCNIPYRNLCWCLFKDAYIGDYHRVPNLLFVIGKRPDITGMDDDCKTIQVYDYNPAYSIAYILSSLAKLPSSFINWDNFNTIADELDTEIRGISIPYEQPTSALRYILSILKHIDGILRYRNDGKLHLKLYRGTETKADLPLITEDDLLKQPVLDRGDM